MKLFSIITAAVLVIVWGICVARFLHEQAVITNGRLAERPTWLDSVLSQVFLGFWGIPSALFLLIWGGIFWW